MRYLLDTCVLSELVKREPSRRVVEWVDDQDEWSLFLSVIVFRELYKGIQRLTESRKRSRLQAWVQQELTRRFAGRILDVDLEVAGRWGQLSGEAERKGQTLPVVDGLLAATALVTGCTLVTRETGHMAMTQVSLLDPWRSWYYNSNNSYNCANVTVGGTRWW